MMLKAGNMSAIAEGLEKLGTVKYDGPASIYKARRIGEIISAVKVLLNPVISENPVDNSLAGFKNDLQKLKRINEKSNPNVARILNSGVTKSGNLPFIEMEFIEGPDLEELLLGPYKPVFPVKECLKVAEHLSNAIAHWHRFNVIHGDIKTTQVKLNVRTGNYVLLDFRPSVTPPVYHDKDPLREGMAPEQGEGKVHFESDVYSFGVILFYLLSGNVPASPGYHINNTGEGANGLENGTQPEGLLSLRQKKIPHIWPEAKKAEEMLVPGWLVSMIYKCIESDPSDRFANGMEVQEHMLQNSAIAASKEVSPVYTDTALQEENKKLLSEKNDLLKNFENEQFFYRILQKEVKELRTAIAEKDTEIQQLAKLRVKTGRGIPRRMFYGSLLLTALLTGLITFIVLKPDQKNTLPEVVATGTADTTAVRNSSLPAEPSRGKDAVIDEPVNKVSPGKEITGQIPAASSPDKTAVQPIPQKVPDIAATAPVSNSSTPVETGTSMGRYKVISKAYFHNEPDENTRRNAFIIHWNNATLTAQDEQQGFIYVVFTNHLGQTSKGWLRKKDLRPVD